MAIGQYMTTNIVTTLVTDMSDLFNATNFTRLFHKGKRSCNNNDTLYWGVSNVTNMANMFRDLKNFNQDCVGCFESFSYDRTV